jgi:hypothetical protein
LKERIGAENLEVVKILSTANSGNGKNLGNSRKDKAKN